MSGWGGFVRLAMQHYRTKGSCEPALFSLIVALLVAPLLLGGAFPWAISVTAFLAALTGLLTSRRLDIRLPERRPARLLDWAVVAALGWTGLQLLPLPASLVSHMNPDVATAWQANAALYGEQASGWMPLSLDPGATRLELAKGLAIAAVYLSARVFASAHQRRAVLVAVGASGACMALLAFAHELAGISKVFGLYEPVYASSRLLAPLMNENHLGGFMAMTCPVLVGLLLDEKTPQRRLSWGLGAACCAMAGVLSFSRSGIIALALGVVLVLGAFVLKLRRNGGSVRSSHAVPMIIAGMFGLVLLLAFIAGPDLAREFGHTENRTSKFEATLSVLPALLQVPVTGVGRGAFSAAFVGELGVRNRFFYPENILVQWTAEWGLLFGLALLALVAWSIVRGFRSARSLSQFGALAGLVAIGVHDLADFALEMSGVAVVAAAMMGAATSSPRVRPEFSLRGLCFLVSGLALVGAGLAASLHGTDTVTLERNARTALEAGDYDHVRELVDRGLQQHPAEPMLALVGAEVAVRRGDPDAVRWLNRAQQLAPLWSAPHLLAARWMFRANRHDQGLIELRQAEASSRGSTRTTICSILRETQNPEIAFRAAPRGPAGLDFLDRTAGCLPPDSTVGAAIDAALRERDPQLVGPALREAQRSLRKGQADQAIALLGVLREPDDEARRTLAEARLSDGDPEGAEQTIAPLLAQPKVSTAALRTALSIYVALGKDTDVQRIAARQRAQTKSDPRSLAAIDLQLGRLYEAEGRYPLALQAYEDANQAIESVETLNSIAQLALKLGHRDRALLTYRHLCRSEGGVGSYCKRAQDLTKGSASRLSHP